VFTSILPRLAGSDALRRGRECAVEQARSGFAIRTVLSRWPLPLEHWR
jgi:hypothetical protein